MTSPLVLTVENLLSFDAFCRLSEADFLSPADVYSFEAPPPNVGVSGNFGRNCRIIVRHGVTFAPNQVLISCFSLPERNRDDITIIFLDRPGQTHFRLFGGSSHFVFGRNIANFNSTISDWGDSGLFIGEGSFCVSARIELSATDMAIGSNCLLSSDIVLQGHDGHGVVDLETLEIINGGRGKMDIGEHVWLGRRATVLKNVRVGAGAIVANSAVVTRDVDACCLAAGMPAKTIRRNVSWSYNAAKIADSELAFFEQFRNGAPEQMAAMA